MGRKFWGWESTSDSSRTCGDGRGVSAQKHVDGGGEIIRSSGRDPLEVTIRKRFITKQTSH